MQIMDRFVDRLRKFQRAALYLPMVLLLLLPVGCGGGNADPQFQTAVDAYWQAIINPKWPTGEKNPLPNFAKAHAALHPEARAKIKLDEFNRQQRKWVKSKNPIDDKGRRGTQTVIGARLGKVEINGETAMGKVVVEFGYPDPVRSPVVVQEVSVNMTLKKDGEHWAVLSVESVPPEAGDSVSAR